MPGGDVDGYGRMSLSQMRRSADMQSDQEKLEQLAATRSELKAALQSLAEHELKPNQKDSDGNTNTSSGNDADIHQYFVATSSFSASMFQMNEGDVELMLRDQLKKVEKDIVELCHQIQKQLDSQGSGSGN
jgi:hypothetical protein